MTYLVMNIGCIECGVSSKPVLVTSSKERAGAVAEACADKFSWRENGQNRFEVFELPPLEAIDKEYASVEIAP